LRRNEEENGPLSAEYRLFAQHASKVSQCEISEVRLADHSLERSFIARTPHLNVRRKFSVQFRRDVADYRNRTRTATRSWRKYYAVNAALRRDKFKLESNLNPVQLVRARVASASSAMRGFSISPTSKRANSKARSGIRRYLPERIHTFHARINSRKSQIRYVNARWKNIGDPRKYRN